MIPSPRTAAYAYAYSCSTPGSDTSVLYVLLLASRSIYYEYRYDTVAHAPPPMRMITAVATARCTAVPTRILVRSRRTTAVDVQPVRTAVLVGLAILVVLYVYRRYAHPPIVLS
jgi:hypothetical protein